MGSFERFKIKTHFNSLKRLVGVTALAALAVKLLTIALATAAGGAGVAPATTSRPGARGSSTSAGPGRGLVAAGPGLVGRVRLPGGREVGQHLRRRRRGVRRLDLHLVGDRAPWDGGVAPGTVPDGTTTGLALVT